MSWPRGGPWILAGTSSGVDWQVAAAAIAAAAEVRVAVLIIGGPEATGVEPVPAGEVLRSQVGTWLHAGDGGAGPLTVADVADLVRALRRAHGLVLVAAPAGLLVPLGAGGWTVADLAVALPAPAVVVTGPGPDSTNHTTLALGALAGHGIPATVVAIGGDAEREDLPVRPAGRIPAGAADSADDFAAAAPDWLDPILHATAGPPRTTPPAGRDRQPSRPGVSGRRLLLVLTAVFVCAVLAACGLAFLNRSAGRPVTLHATTVRVTSLPHPVNGYSGPPVAVRPPVPVPRPTRPAIAVCPQNSAGVVATRAGRTTRRRVDAAWQRIEDWLTGHAPASRRALRAPAGQARIDRLQRQMSVAFPADLVASLRRHDGVSSAGFQLPPFFSPLPADRIVAEWAVSCQVLANLGAGWDDWWQPAFVPFAGAGDGGCLLVDQRPGGHGRVGEFYPDNGTTFDHWPASVTELLERTATSLETGRLYDGRYRPEVDARGRLDWAII